MTHLNPHGQPCECGFGERLQAKQPSKFHTTLEDHERGKARHHERTLLKRSAIAPEPLQEFMDTRGPYLYHSTDPDAARRILDEGLYPHDVQSPSEGNKLVQVTRRDPETGEEIPVSRSKWDQQFFAPRPGHTYLGTQETAERYAGTKGAMLRVDLRKLDPTRINADEDAFFGPDWGGLNSHYPVVQKVYEDDPPPDPNYAEGYTLGDWAEQANLGQDPAETHHSLFAHGAVAYDGVIPPEAIERKPPDARDVGWKPKEDWGEAYDAQGNPLSWSGQQWVPMTAAMNPPDLNQAENIFGPLSGEVRARLMAVINDPNPATWDDARTIILNNRGMGTTLWQAVLALQHGGEVPLTADPNEVPSRDQIIQAIRYATG